MTYKTIVAVLSTAEDAGKVTDHALALARRTGGHVIGIHAEAPVVVTLIAPMEYPDPNAVLQLQDRAQQQSRAVEEAFRSRCERDDISYEWRLFTGSAGYASAGVIDSARSADIVIAAQFDPDIDGPAREDIEDLLYESGRPLYLVSNAQAGPAPIERVLVAWNGSRESTRAVFDALPFLTAAREVEIFAIDPPETALQSRDFCGAELAATLARHGVRATVSSGASEGRSVADALNHRATEIDAGLIVMGAYSHSRLRQRLFGGVTSALMRGARVPTLMSR
ncbi:universal stress protein [Shinella sp. AETb1-6]|jgi:nucleotide-binding universal stress UspA family protein|uniref:universal stress protein n=1 Tax=Shinella sp. AETb1-6 TaxID=2692210 RepID=UPI0013680440|nr:universal stress protein [Shinella sp. AETb1-6]MXN53309.1 universal stress protein [Shinella sp. AETb1-6]